MLISPPSFSWFTGLISFFFLWISVGAAAPSIFVAYPPKGHRVPFSHVLLEGSVTAGSTLKIDGRTAAVGADGLYILWWPLKPGINNLKMVSTLGGRSTVKYHKVIRKVPYGMPSKPTAIQRSSVWPNIPLEFWDIARDQPHERTVTISFRGSKYGKARFRVAGGPLYAMHEGPLGTYTGRLTLPITAKYNKAPIRVYLTGKNRKTVERMAAGRLTVRAGTFTGVYKAGLVKGIGLNQASTVIKTLNYKPFIYPRTGMTFHLVGREGHFFRARLAPGVSALVKKAHLHVQKGRPTLARSGPLYLASASQSPKMVFIPSSEEFGVVDSEEQSVSQFSPRPRQQPLSHDKIAQDLAVYIPLGGQKVPFQLSQSADGQQIHVMLYGLRELPAAQNLQTVFHPLLKGISVFPGTGNSAKVVLFLKTGQIWGHTANFEGADLVVRVRQTPQLNVMNPLQGRVITLDPGHGGSNLGGAGSFKLREKYLVLPITIRIAELLRSMGATIHLTRTADTSVSLVDRGLMAEKTKSDMVISIHANAIADGRNPKYYRGPEMYYSHAQAKDLSQAILKQLRQRLPELGRGVGLKPNADLAMARPTTQMSVLVELAYLTDPENLRALHNNVAREKMAQAVAQGILDFYKQSIKE